MRVDHLESVYNPVVLSEPHYVHRSERRVLVDTTVASAVTKLSLLDVRTLVVGGICRVWQQLSTGVVETHVHSARGPALGPESGRFVGRRTVNLGSVYEGGYLVHLLARSQPTSGADGSSDKVQTTLFPVGVKWVVRGHQDGEALRV